MPMESSTVTNCSPPPWRSRSVRPSVGRISARAPVTQCERLSLVETWTVSRARRIASSVTAVSGEAATKLPPMAKKTLAWPSRMRADGPYDVEAVLAGRGDAELPLQRVEEGGPGRSKMPIVRSPCTLLCPRTGHTPAPGRPTSPRSSRRLTTSRMVGTECLCWVRPIAQHTTVRREASTISRARSISARSRPVAVERLVPVGGAGGVGELLVAVGVFADELLVDAALGLEDEAVEHAEERLVAAEPDLEEQVGQRGAAARPARAGSAGS